MLVSIYFLLKGQLQWNLDGVLPTNNQPSALLIVGCTILLIFLLFQWRGIVNSMKVEQMSLSSVEHNHPYLPHGTEMIMTVILTLIALILGTQFVMQAHSACEGCEGMESSSYESFSSSASSETFSSSSWWSSSSSSVDGGISSSWYGSSSSLNDGGVSSSFDSGTSGGTSGGTTGASTPDTWKPSSVAANVPAAARLTVHVFQDINNDGTQQTFEPAIVRGQVRIQYGASADDFIETTLQTNADGRATITTMPVLVSAAYTVTIEPETIGEDWVAAPVAGTAPKGTAKTIEIPIRLRILLAPYEPCISLASGTAATLASASSGPHRMLQLLSRSDGRAIAMLDSSRSLASRGEFLALLQSLTLCTPLTGVPLDKAVLEQQRIAHQTKPFADLRTAHIEDDAITHAFFEAYARALPDVQIKSPKGLIASSNGTLTWANAVHWIYALIALRTPALATQATDAQQLSLLQEAGVVPVWLTVDQLSKTIGSSQALKTALLAMYASGTFDLTTPIATDESRNTPLQPFIEKMGRLPFITNVSNRSFKFAQFFPNDAVYLPLQRIVATASATKDGDIYTLGNFTTNGGALFIETRSATDPIYNAEFLRTAALLLGTASPQSRNDALARLQQINTQGAGAYTQIVGFLIDIFGLPRSSALTVAGRVAASAQTVGSDVLSLFSFSASTIQTREKLTPNAPVTREHFARIIGSLVTINTIRNKQISVVEGNETSDQVYQAVYVLLTGKKTSQWGKDLKDVMNQPVTLQEFVQVIDAILQQTTDQTKTTLPILWLSVIR
ncbi:MAG: hypothetical protein KBD00_02085 [Candidatus Peribacteraceae bacterium]|nr:hypothetical protein [Candidatus Peribacteraceae bacterium]